jgi:hypothetical protein
VVELRGSSRGSGWKRKESLQRVGHVSQVLERQGRKAHNIYCCRISPLQGHPSENTRRCVNRGAFCLLLTDEESASAAARIAERVGRVQRMDSTLAVLRSRDILLSWEEEG